MTHCNDNVPGAGVAGGYRVSNDPPDSQEAALETTLGQQARYIEIRSGEGDDGAGDGRLVEGEGGNVSGKRGKARKVYKGGNRGKKKAKWSQEERKVLWECFVRSGGKKSGGYIRKVKEM